MKKVILVALLIPAIAVASHLTVYPDDDRLPEKFCQGVKEDGQSYREHIENVRVSDYYRKRWIKTLEKIQRHQCLGKVNLPE